MREVMRTGGVKYWSLRVKARRSFDTTAAAIVVEIVSRRSDCDRPAGRFVGVVVVVKFCCAALRHHNHLSEFFREAFDYGIIRRARAASLLKPKRTTCATGTTTSTTCRRSPFGGGEAWCSNPNRSCIGPGLTGTSKREEYSPGTRVVLLSPQARFSRRQWPPIFPASQIVLICGRYEGVDERVGEALATDEISIGDYVLSGGEPAAVVLIDAVVRLLPGALGNETSAANESFSEGLLDHPQYTRPTEHAGLTVPEVLLTGNHGEIARWRREAALRKTQRNRPDLLK